jgi:hypothetical protein
LKPARAIAAVSLIGDWERWKKPAPVNPNGSTEKAFLQVWIEKKRNGDVITASAGGGPNPANAGSSPGQVPG